MRFFLLLGLSVFCSDTTYITSFDETINFCIFNVSPFLYLIFLFLLATLPPLLLLFSMFCSIFWRQRSHWIGFFSVHISVLSVIWDTLQINRSKKKERNWWYKMLLCWCWATFSCFRVLKARAKKIFRFFFNSFHAICGKSKSKSFWNWCCDWVSVYRSFPIHQWVVTVADFKCKKKTSSLFCLSLSFSWCGCQLGYSEMQKAKC